MGDNFNVRVTSAGKPHFEMAVRMIFGAAPGAKATHYLRGGLPERQCLNECAGHPQESMVCRWAGTQH